MESATQRSKKTARSMRAHLMRALQSRAGLRQGFWLMEILSPPLAQRRRPALPGGRPGPQTGETPPTAS
jgi:hypothetical protein